MKTRTTLPVMPSSAQVLVSAGPDVSPRMILNGFDRRIAELGMKHRIGNFIRSQDMKNRLVREPVSPDDLGRVVLKHARRKLSKHPELNPANAISAAGVTLLDHYTAEQYKPQVFRAFVDAVHR